MKEKSLFGSDEIKGGDSPVLVKAPLLEPTLRQTGWTERS